MPYRITKNCNQCERCAKECPLGAIERDRNYNFFILQRECNECGDCVKVCPIGAIAWEERLDYKMEESIQNNIKCPVFRESDEIIKNIILKLEKVNPREKQDYAQDILVEANTLLLCSDYNSKNPDCSNCHCILRKYLQEYGHLSKSIG